MSPNVPLDTAARHIQSMDRDQCIRELLDFDAIPLDFTRDCLSGMSTERLRHLLMAALVTCRNRRGRAAQR